MEINENQLFKLHFEDGVVGYLDYNYNYDFSINTKSIKFWKRTGNGANIDYVSKKIKSIEVVDYLEILPQREASTVGMMLWDLEINGESIKLNWKES